MKYEYVDSTTLAEAVNRDKADTIGLRVGYRFGQLANDRGPKVVEKVVIKEVIKEKYLLKVLM